ncbi:hypothetical protein D3C76_531510 [compost metagenome]
MHQVLGDVKADTAGTDHRHLLPYRLALQQHIQVVQHLGVLDAGDGRQTRSDAGGEDDLVKAARRQLLGIDAGVQAQLDASGLQLAFEVAQGFIELLFARHALGHVELTADLAGRIEQGHFMAALGRHGGGS